MKTIDYTIECTNEYTIHGYLSQQYPKEDLLFFDIETTGFVAKNTTLYLIGVLWFANNQLHIRQWFNEDGISEKDLIVSFTSFTANFSYLVHFNGLGFDLPYLRQKSEQLGIPFDFEHTMNQIDIYKEIRPFKNIFALDNLKQVSIERFLNIAREDVYSGKDLINMYQRYVASPSQSVEDILLLHNHDDLLGMTQISQMLHYKYFINNPEIETVNINKESNQLIIQFTINSSVVLPRRITISNQGIYLNAVDNHGTLHIPIKETTLKHFFSDYKNYYYLPLEDMAIHKSIATYVDSPNKIKATKNTCYIKKSDAFIPCFNKESDQIFFQEPNNKQQYCTVDFIQKANFETQIQYVKNTLQTFL